MTGPTPTGALSLLDDADRRTQQLLELDVDRLGADAAALTRTWGELVQTVAEVAELLPTSPAAGEAGDPFLSTVRRLDAITQQLHRLQSTGVWPGPGPADERLLDVSSTVLDAGRLLSAATPDGRLTGPQLAHARHQVLHLLMVGGQAVHRAANWYLADNTPRPGRPARRPPGRERNPAVLPAVRPVCEHLADFTAIASAAVGGRRYSTAAAGDSLEQRLTAAVAAWDVQAQRTVLATPAAADLAAVCLAQADLVRRTVEFTEAATVAGVVHGLSAQQQRLTRAAHSSEHTWSAAAAAWRRLDPKDQRWNSPELRAAGRDLRAALTATAAAGSGRRPSRGPASLDWESIVHTMHGSAAAAHDLSRLVRSAAETAPLAAQASHYARLVTAGERLDHAESEHESFLSHGPARYSRETIPLPSGLREPVLSLCDRLVASAGTLSAALMDSGGVGPWTCVTHAPAALPPGAQREHRERPGHAGPDRDPGLGMGTLW